jgi:CHASE1-domain containing sensor protein
MAKRRNVGTGVAVSGALAVSAWSPMTGILVAGVLLVLAVTAAVVVLTAARGRDRRQQKNSADVLDRLLRDRSGR